MTICQTQFLDGKGSLYTTGIIANTICINSCCSGIGVILVGKFKILSFDIGLTYLGQSIFTGR